MSPMTPPSDAPLVNRLVHAMLEFADPKADQNVWDLARAAEEVFRANAAEEFFRTGDAEQLRRQIADAGLSPTGRMVMQPVPFGYASGEAPAQRPVGPVHPDHIAELGDIKRLLFAKMPKLAQRMSTRDLIDQLIQDHQAMEQDLAASRRQLQALNLSFQEVVGTADELRKTLDPDGQFEAETLGGVARERMNLLAARKQEIEELRAEKAERVRQGTLFEEASAERMRKLLGATEGERLDQAAMRVKEQRDGARRRLDQEIGAHEEFNTTIRKIVGAHDEYENGDQYAPHQPTLDAVRRIVARLWEIDREQDGSRRSFEEIRADAQAGWIEDGFTPLPEEVV